MTRPSWLLGLLACSAPLGCTDPAVQIDVPVLDTLRLTVQSSHLRDSLGRDVLLRGVNAGGRSKLPPYFPFPFAESGAADQSNEPAFDAALESYSALPQAWGLDVVRLPFFWEALEPTAGHYDEQYLDRYAAMAERMGQRGLRVIVDFHQDVFARPLCGDGFPLWALPQPDMTPRTACAGQWFFGYFGDPEVNAAFDRFWANADALQGSFAAMWQHVAARLWPIRGVIGFEIINEPHNGSAVESDWAASVLTPFYAQMTDVIRAQAPGALVIVEPSARDPVDGSTVLPRPEGEGIVFSMHYYAAGVFVSGPDKGGYDTDADLSPWGSLRDAWNLPLLVGELGCKTGTQGGGRYLSANLRSLDTLLLHGTVWEYSTTQDDWNAEGMSITGYHGQETPSAEALVRAYPRAVSGTLQSFRFDPDARQGFAELEAVPGVTEIAAPARLYPTGVDVTLAGAPGQASWDAERGLLLVETLEPGPASIAFGPAAP